MVAGSAAVAVPLLLGPPTLLAAAEHAANADIAKGTKIYFIGHGCVGCHACLALCPSKAVHFGNTGDEIDQSKCLHCGTCYKECPISVISETEF